MDWERRGPFQDGFIQRKPVPHRSYPSTHPYSPAPAYDSEANPETMDVSVADEPPRMTQGHKRTPSSTHYLAEVPAPLKENQHAYQPYISDFSDAPYGTRTPPDFPLKPEQYNKISIDPKHTVPYGVPIQSAWRKDLLTWLLALLAIAFFIFTVIFASNATRGDQADTRLLFSDPGRTILVLQILTNVTTTLFGELLVASCEMVVVRGTVVI